MAVDTPIKAHGPQSAVRAGTLAELEDTGYLTTKVGHVPVVVFRLDDELAAIEDRCPHLGFPLHRGTVEAELLTCHWHHARFDLRSGCTLDPWADDARAFDAETRGTDVWVSARPTPDRRGRLRRRLTEGLEDGLTLVVAKAVLGLLEDGEDPREIVRAGMDFGLRYREQGWGAGLTVLVALTRALPYLDEVSRPLALVHGLTFLADDTRGNPPRFVRSALPDDHDEATLHDWYRRFVDTRSAPAAERTLASAISGGDLRAVETMMDAALTDHVFVDGGHSLDFTNKAFEAVELLGAETATEALTSLVRQSANASRSEEFSEWQHPRDLTVIIADADLRLRGLTSVDLSSGSASDAEVAALADGLLAEDPQQVADAVVEALGSGHSLEQAARAVALAAALRIVRFHTQNEHSDWDTAHHTFTYANAVHQSARRAPSLALTRAVIHGALKVYLDRFLNVPAAHLSAPAPERASIEELAGAWESQGHVNQAGAAARDLVLAGRSSELIAELGRALLAEDAGFHWYQMFEAAITQSEAWPDRSQQRATVLAAFARFLAAHTPTRREQTTTFDIARRLGRGDNLFESTAPEPT